MKKKILNPILVVTAIFGSFLVGPSIGQSLYRWITPNPTIEAWRNECRDLDQIFPRTFTNESKRIDIARKLSQRGIHVDPGIRDEAIEHNVNPYTIFVMTCWRWKDLLGIP